MKARLVPLAFGSCEDPDLVTQIGILRELLVDEAEIGETVPLGTDIAGADAVIFPQLVGDAYRRSTKIAALELPILVLTSEFGTMAMWDWEIVSYLKGKGVDAIAPYTLEQAKISCRALVAKRQLREGKFLVYQDRPGEGGFQAGIFKRFYWWEDECGERMRDRFGLAIVKNSFQALGERARSIADAEARVEWQRWQSRVPLGPMSEQAALSAIKLYLAVRRDVEAEPNVLAAGINCLNESSFSDTTPCLAWNLLYQDKDLIWGCEGDTVSMLTKFIVHRSLRVPIMMTNLYPFLMGQAALKHERIPDFPTVEEPENHLLAAHCGYLGVVPQPFATDWTLRGKVLAIVDQNATAIDARLPLGDLTLSKLDPTFRKLVVAEGTLTGYAQYPGSDCLNGAVIKVRDGHALMDRLPSHHSLLTTGHNLTNIKLLSRIFALDVEEL